ncbi:hydantoinase/oxoprolinase family protein [Rhodophyticola porphyridii]|uniref:Hydantoinase/oxoprolinase family protein n=1 Tax=Rhodophyticola porphyridii TaxID=1852017 RepID=A0A3L9XWM1_9RHOB|nr:hydantoinase/oxoprolinase family protein [Rhodophyticola porphyridii]RMA40702.1 hydantoinase/oxoprolinase family protein [Rhodophyticola porphyridii]
MSFDGADSARGAGPALTLAVDIGGTFTDVALADIATGQVWRAKTPSRPDDPSEAFLTGLRLALRAAGAVPGDLRQVLHGTTVATNMILEGKGARAALVTTRGFRHVLGIGRQDIPRAANLYNWIKPERPVPASRIVEVAERVLPGGVVTQPLDEDSVAAAAESLREMCVDAVAICLLHAFANPEHERRTAEILRAALPGIAVTASSDVLPVVREYERTLASVLNAIVMPGVTKYVGRIEDKLTAEGVPAPLLLMQSNGGVAGADKIRSAPALTALSGPAAGVVGARSVAAASGINDILTVDIGGTSADICLVSGGKIGLTQQGQVGDWPLPLPMVDMVTIGAGGGSIARVADGVLTVGPESAGATPGPAAYGRGGTEATVTDAHVVLGHLPARLLGGDMALDVVAARRALEDGVARPLGIAVEDAARGILAIADNKMVGALRVVSVERGFDPRDFTLLPFGGAGPLHGCALADLIGTRRVLIVPAPGILCADGLMAADLKSEFSRARPRAGVADMAEAERLCAELEADAAVWFDAEDVAEADRQTSRVALLRYAGQGNELAVPWADTVEALEAGFVAAHRALYGFELSAPIELVTLRVEARATMQALAPAVLAPGDPPVPVDHVPIALPSGRQTVPLFDRSTMKAGAIIEGPAIVSQLDTTTLITPGWTGTVQTSGALLLTKADT